MNAHTHSIQTFPLAQITLSPMNPRQTHDPFEIEALAMSIAVAGLLQPLACYQTDKRHVEVVDGGRRLAALQYLQTNGSGLMHWAPPDWSAIPCNVTTDDFQAQAWAGAAAASFLPLTASQEIRAYAAMADKHLPPEAIGRAFAVTTRHVKQRLKLANLSEATLNELATGTITLDVAQILTLAPSPEREAQLLANTIENRWGTHSLRMEIAKNQITATDRRAVFVGLDAYQDAGGVVIEDLFGTHTMLQDAGLLQKLFTEKLDAAAREMAQGWSWFTTIYESYYVSFGDTEGCQRVLRTPGELSEADTEDYERLCDLNANDALDEDGIAKLCALEDRIDGDWTDEEYATCGAFVLVDRDGAPRIEGGWRRKDAAPQTDSTDETETTEKVDTTPQTIPDNCRQDFQRIQLAAAQTAALGKFDQLLFLLAFQLSAGHIGYSKPLAIDLRPHVIAPEKDSGLRIDPRLQDPATDYNSPGMAEFDAFVAKGTKHRNAMLTQHLARCITPHTMSPFQAALIKGWATDVRAIWTPDAMNCFGRMPAPMLDAIWAELVPHEKAELAGVDFAAVKKKGDKAKALERLFSDAGYRETLGLSRDEANAIDAWVPDEMKGGSPS